MILVVEASAAVDLLVRSDAGERVRHALTGVGAATLMTVAHLDAEVVSALASLHRANVLTHVQISDLLDRLATLAMQRLPITQSLLQTTWGMRDNIAARDALYVAATTAVDGKLVTTDDRLARAVPGLALVLT